MEKKQISVIKTCRCPPFPRARWTTDPSEQCWGSRGLSVRPLVLLLCSLPDVLCQHLPLCCGSLEVCLLRFYFLFSFLLTPSQTLLDLLLPSPGQPHSHYANSYGTFL